MYQTYARGKSPCEISIRAFQDSGERGRCWITVGDNSVGRVIDRTQGNK